MDLDYLASWTLLFLFSYGVKLQDASLLLHTNEPTSRIGERGDWPSTFKPWVMSERGGCACALEYVQSSSRPKTAITPKDTQEDPHSTKRKALSVLISVRIRTCI